LAIVRKVETAAEALFTMDSRSARHFGDCVRQIPLLIALVPTLPALSDSDKQLPPAVMQQLVQGSLFCAERSTERAQTGQQLAGVSRWQHASQIRESAALCGKGVVQCCTAAVEEGRE
jgi:hypothetical protein